MENAAYVGVLAIAIGAVALLTGHYAVLLALAPTVYLLGTSDEREITGTTVLTTHLLAVVAGVIAYLLFAQGIDPLSVEAQSSAAFRVILSPICALILTGIGLALLDEQFVTAHVMTTIVALGLLRTPQALGTLILSIALLASIHTLFGKFDSTDGQLTT
ncbi:hypothetical protein SAMN05216564_10352 [Halopenitus persicus]|uniref:HPP family protein n=2 Tax=Halopenitus persicus TaxID=1048396 RepID=A0A1H3H1L9_9EURY|nr:hypothetical protein SAMN05216564_10352 [Halopenitus persicus]